MSKNCSLAETGELLKAAKKLVIVSHVSPDGDTLGSSLALMHALRALGKDVIMNVDDDISTVYSFLPGIQEYRRFGADETIEADLLVIIDASSADRAGNAMEVVRPGAVLNIDHHKIIKQIHGLRIICIWIPMLRQPLKSFTRCCWRWEQSLPQISQPVFTKASIRIQVHSNIPIPPPKQWKQPLRY